MSLTRNDALATALVAVAVVLVALAEEAAWVAVAVLALGVAAYALDARHDAFPGLRRLVPIAAMAAALAIVAAVTGAFLPLVLLAGLVVGCWLITTADHVASRTKP